MRYLLYCIFHSPSSTSYTHSEIDRREAQKPESLLGVDGHPVVLVSNNSLSAAISRIPHCPLPLDVSRLLAYKRVIESFHREQTVIPMRYGCLFEEELQITKFLEKRSCHYGSLLKELKGCVEMGVRIFLAGTRFLPPTWKSLHSEEISDSAIPNPCMSVDFSPSYIRKEPSLISPGRTFLASRKAYYAQEEKVAGEIQDVFQQCRSAFAGLFVKCKTEIHAIHTPQSEITNPKSEITNPLLSLYFLMPIKSVKTFRRVFQDITLKESAQLLISGPWPPYNFVMPHHSQDWFRFSNSDKEGVR